MIATDAVPGIIETVASKFPVEGVVAEAEWLPFAADAFDAVSCRIAAHHFPDPLTFDDEVARVTEDGSVFALEDNIAPPEDELDGFLNAVERLRGPTHVRSYTEPEWECWLTDAGFEIEERQLITKEIDYSSWVRQLATTETAREQLRDLFADSLDGAADLFEITYENGELVSFCNLMLLVCARR